MTRYSSRYCTVAFCYVHKCELSYICPGQDIKLHQHWVKLYRTGCTVIWLGIGEGANVIISKYVIRFESRLLRLCSWIVLLWTVLHCYRVTWVICIVSRWPSLPTEPVSLPRSWHKLIFLCWRAVKQSINQPWSIITYLICVVFSCIVIKRIFRKLESKLYRCYTGGIQVYTGGIQVVWWLTVLVFNMACSYISYIGGLMAYCTGLQYGMLLY